MIEVRFASACYRLLAAVVLAVVSAGAFAPQAACADWIATMTRHGPKAPVNDSILALEESAHTGLAESQYRLALLYLNGEEGKARDVETAVDWLARAADGGWVPAQQRLGALLDDGVDVERDARRAARYLAMAGTRGGADAQYRLGKLFAAGDGVVANEGTAFEWFERAAVQRDPRAQVRVCRRYRDGRGVARHPGWALYWCRLAAEQDDRDGLDALGELYEQGVGVRRDLARAAELYRRAEKQGKVYTEGRLARLERRAVTDEEPLAAAQRGERSSAAPTGDRSAEAKPKPLASAVGSSMPTSPTLVGGATVGLSESRLVHAITRHRGVGDYEGVLNKLGELEDRELRRPRSYHFYYGESLYRIGRRDLARALLERYVETQGRRGRYYNEATRMLDRLADSD